MCSAHKIQLKVPRQSYLVNTPVIMWIKLAEKTGHMGLYQVILLLPSAEQRPDSFSHFGYILHCKTGISIKIAARIA